MVAVIHEFTGGFFWSFVALTCLAGVVVLAALLVASGHADLGRRRGTPRVRLVVGRGYKRIACTDN